MTSWDSNYAPETLDEMTDRERLLYWGFKSEHIIDLPDGSAIPDYAAVKRAMDKERALKLQKSRTPRIEEG